MNIFEQNYLKTKATYSKVEQENRETVSTAHFAFGGHISKGLLKRGRSCSEKINRANEKQGRVKIFFDLSKFKNLNGFGISPQEWEEISEIIYKMTLWKDIGDSYDYREASVTNMVYTKKEAIKQFIQKYAGKRIGRQLINILFSYNPYDSNSIEVEIWVDKSKQ